MEKITQYNIEIFQVLSQYFLLNFLFCPGFLTFGDKFQTISGTEQKIYHYIS